MTLGVWIRLLDPVGSSSLESGNGLGDLNLMKQPINTQTLVLH